MSGIGTAITRVRINRGWDRLTGDFEEWVYEGPPSAITTYASQFRNSNTRDYRVDEGPGKHILTVRYDKQTTGDNSPIVQLRQVVNRVHKDIFEPPWQGTITEADIRKIKHHTEQDISTAPVGLSADGITLYSLVLKGLRYRVVYQPVVQLILTAPYGFVWPSNNEFAGKISSSAQLISRIQALTGAAPNFAFPSGTSPDPTLYEYGWLVHLPNYDSDLGGKTTETSEFEWGLWAKFLYPSIP